MPFVKIFSYDDIKISVQSFLVHKMVGLEFFANLEIALTCSSYEIRVGYQFTFDPDLRYLRETFCRSELTEIF